MIGGPAKPEAAAERVRSNDEMDSSPDLIGF